MQGRDDSRVPLGFGKCLLLAGGLGEESTKVISLHRSKMALGGIHPHPQCLTCYEEAAHEDLVE